MNKGRALPGRKVSNNYKTKVIKMIRDPNTISHTEQINRLCPTEGKAMMKSSNS